MAQAKYYKYSNKNSRLSSE